MSDPLGGGALPDADATVARLREQVAQAQETARRADEMKDRFEAIRGRAASPRDEVRVTVETSGRLTALELDESARDLTAKDLAALILRTVGEAQRRAADESMALVAETFGPESPVAENLRGELARMVPPDPSGSDLRWS